MISDSVDINFLFDNYILLCCRTKSLRCVTDHWTLYFLGGRVLYYGCIFIPDNSNKVFSILAVYTGGLWGFWFYRYLYFRYFHSAVYLDYLKTMYVYGGFVKAENGNIQASNEMWKFAIGAHKWTVEVKTFNSLCILKLKLDDTRNFRVSLWVI